MAERGAKKRSGGTCTAPAMRGAEALRPARWKVASSKAGSGAPARRAGSAEVQTCPSLGESPNSTKTIENIWFKWTEAYRPRDST